MFKGSHISAAYQYWNSSRFPHREGALPTKARHMYTPQRAPESRSLAVGGDCPQKAPDAPHSDSQSLSATVEQAVVQQVPVDQETLVSISLILLGLLADAVPATGTQHPCGGTILHLKISIFMVIVVWLLHNRYTKHRGDHEDYLGPTPPETSGPTSNAKCRRCLADDLRTVFPIRSTTSLRSISEESHQPLFSV